MPLGKSKKKSKVEPEAPKIPSESMKPRFNPEYDFMKFLKERDFLTGLEDVMKKDGKEIVKDDEEFEMKLDILKSSIR